MKTTGMQIEAGDTRVSIYLDSLEPTTCHAGQKPASGAGLRGDRPPITVQRTENRPPFASPPTRVAGRCGPREGAIDPRVLTSTSFVPSALLSFGENAGGNRGEDSLEKRASFGANRRGWARMPPHRQAGLKSAQRGKQGVKRMGAGLALFIGRGWITRGADRRRSLFFVPMSIVRPQPLEGGPPSDGGAEGPA